MGVLCGFADEPMFLPRKSCIVDSEAKFISLVVQIYFYKNTIHFTNKEVQAMYYTVIKHDRHLRTRGNVENMNQR